MRLVYLRLTLALFLSVLGGSRSAWAGADRFAAAADHYRLQRWQQACDEFAGLLAAEPGHPRAAEARFFYGESLVQLGRWKDARSQFAEVLKADTAGPHARQALFRSAEAAYMIGDDRAALGDLTAFWQRYPDDPLNAYVLPYLGSLELQSGQVNEAQQRFALALERFKDGPLAAESRFGLAQALERSDKLGPALKEYRAVIEAGGPLAEQALLQVATAENGLGNYQAALAALDQFSARFPSSALADKNSLGRGYSLHKLGRHREAQDALQTITGKPEVGQEASYWLALVQKAQDNYPAASEILRGIRVDAHHPLAAAISFHLAEAELHAGQFARAQEAFDRVVAHFADSPWADDAQLGKLQVALERKEHAESIRLADELAARFPQSPLVRQATLAKGQALAALDKPADAVAALEPLLESIQTTPTDADAEIRARTQATLAVAHAKLGHWKESQQWLTALGDAKTAGSLASETTYQVAELALAAGDATLAQQLFKSVTSGDGAAEVAGRAQSGLAWSHFNAGRYREAAEEFDKVLAADPKGPLSAEAALLKGRSLEHLEQFEPALAMYRQVGEQNPKSPRVPEALFASARLYEKLGRTAEARQSYAWLVDNYPDFAELDAALFRYALLLEPADAAASEKLLMRLRTQFSKSPLAHDATLRLAERAVEQEKYADAERLLSDVTGPATPDKVRSQALYLSGRLELARRQWSAATWPLEQLMREFPDGELTLPASYLLAEADFRQENYEKAAARLADLAAKSAGRTDAWLAMAELRRAQALAHLKIWSDALATARGISARFADFDQQFEVDYLVGRCLAAQADFAGARDAYKKVIDSPTGSRTETGAMARWMTGESYFHQENYAAASAEYLKVDEQYPRWHAGALLQAGKCAESLGRWQLAAEHYQKLIEKYPQGDLTAEATGRLTAARQRATGASPSLK